MNSEEKKYQKQFCDRYFGKTTWDQEVNRVDVVLKGKRGQNLLYIEFKYLLNGQQAHRKALAQIIITNKKQRHILDHVALAYLSENGDDVLELIDCSENAVMFNNDINWEAETASEPSQDAIDRINDRIRGKITPFIGKDIHELYNTLRNGDGTSIEITERNFNVVYNQWKNTIQFLRPERDESELINLFLTDMLNGTKYEYETMADISEPSLFGPMTVDNPDNAIAMPLLREGTNLAKYELERCCGKIRIVWDNYIIHAIQNAEGYETFWRKYKRPPEKLEYLKILEHSAELYTESYRRDTGGEYTPTCFVELQNQLLAEHYNLNDFIVCDPCAGVGNLENQFGKEYKDYCYLSTLEQMDVDICRIKGFDNTIRFDYLRDNRQPTWKYRGQTLDINEIAQLEDRKLMVVMNPPYTRQKGHKDNLALEFFDKVLALKPDVIVYYCKTEFFLRSTVSHFVDANYRVVAHIFSNAKDTFKLSEWAVSLVIFDRENGEILDGNTIKADRYEKDHNSGKLKYVNTYAYDNQRPNLIKEIEAKIKKDMTGMVLGQWSYLNSVLKISNGGKEKNSKITTNNLKWCLLSKGLNFNTHHKYFEWNYLVYRGSVDDIPSELFNDAVMFSLFFKGILFTNKGQHNYIMPFKADELGCSVNDLNVLFPDNSGNNDFFAGEPEQPFDFRQFLAQFDFSAEAKALYAAALQMFRYYHHSDAYQNKDWNDSFYDITNAIMQKDVSSFKKLDDGNDRRITKVKTTKGTHGFGRNTIAAFVPEDKLPLFYDFFDKRDALAVKINDELLAAHLLLWKRENIF